MSGRDSNPSGWQSDHARACGGCRWLPTPRNDVLWRGGLSLPRLHAYIRWMLRSTMSSSHSDSTRREFLKGKAAVRAARGLLPADSEQAAPDAGPEQNKPSSRYLIHVGRRAMACQFDLIFQRGAICLGQ